MARWRIPGLAAGAAAAAVAVLWSGSAGATLPAGSCANLSNSSTVSNSVVVCGDGNSTGAASYAFVGGGQQNTASNSYASVGGGQQNSASGDAAAVGGGLQNSASGPAAAVGGGEQNTASGTRAAVGGGRLNTASNDYASVGGGYANTASMQYASVGGGYSNTAAANYASVGGGNGNRAAATFASIGGGSDNRVYGSFAAVGGGLLNVANAGYSSIGGGSSNLASGVASSIGGGGSNQTLDAYAAVAGGIGNVASGYVATVAGGGSNTASGNFSLAAGYNAKAVHNGAFVWNGLTDPPLFSHGVNTFSARATGGFRLYTSAAGGAELPSGSGSWGMISDRAAKRDIAPVDPAAILAKVAALPLGEWSYLEEGSVRHIGPMAQDFRAAFGLGPNDTTISTVDADGVALAAIQGLKQEKDAEIAALHAKVATLESGGSPAPSGIPGEAILAIGFVAGCALLRRR